MSTSYTRTLTTPLDPHAAYEHAANPQQWWITMIEGQARNVGDLFEFDVPQLHHAKFRVSEAVPGRRLAWDVVETNAETELPEWIGTRIEFTFAPAERPRHEEDDTAPSPGSTVTFTHHGLTPSLDCHETCSTAWDHHLGDGLSALLNGKQPDPVTPEQAADLAAENRGH